MSAVNVPQLNLNNRMSSKPGVPKIEKEASAQQSERNSSRLPVSNRSRAPTGRTYTQRTGTNRSAASSYRSVSQYGEEGMGVEDLRRKQMQLTDKLFSLIGELHLAEAKERNPRAQVIPNQKLSPQSKRAFFRNQMITTSSSTYGMIYKQPELLTTNRHRRKKTDLSKGRY